MVKLAISVLTINIILISLMLLLIAALLYLFYLRFTKNLFSTIFKRPEPMPKIDRSPAKIDQSTIYGRGKNWFYTNRNEYINVRIDSFDKTKLSGYFRPSHDRNTKFAVLLMHGYNEHPSEMAAYARLMMRQIECHVLIAHERAHAMSGGKYTTYGVYESVDLNRWIEFLKLQIGNDAKIFIVGRSMGAVASLLAASQPDFSPNVAGIIADCPYDRLTDVLLSSGKKRYNIDMSTPLKTVDKIAKTNLGFNLDACDAAVNAGRIRVPTLIFSAGDDTIVPPEGARRIYDNIRVPKRLVMVDHCKHIMCYNDATSTYEKEVRKFIEECVFRLVSQGKM